MKFKRIIISAFLFVFYMSLHAEEMIYKDSVSLDEVVVTGSRVRSSARNIPSTITIIDSAQIANSGSTNIMPILSQYVPGLFVTERGIAGYGVAAGSAGAITIRGVGSAGTPPANTQVLFLIDGHPQFMGLMGHHLSDSYLSENIERVEVIRGPGSVLYGSNAMGGVVNLITKKQRKEGYFGTLNASYGSYDTQHYSANAMMKSGKWSGFISLEHEQTNGARTNSQYKSNSGYAKLGYAFSDRFNLTGDFNLTKYKANDPDSVTASSTNLVKWADISRGMASLTLENQFENTSGSIILFLNFGDHDIYDGYHSTDHCAGVNIYQSFSIFKGSVIAGFDYENYGGFAENQTLNDAVRKLMQFPVDKTIHETAGYASIQQVFFKQILSVNGGIRYTTNSAYGGEWIPQGGISVRPFRRTTIKASVSKGFRSPTVKELYMFPSHNETLQPEKMMNYELSWQQNWLNGNLSTEVTSFIAKGSNLIKQITMQYLNTGSFLNKGIEVAGDYKMSDRLNVMINYSFLYMDTPMLAAPKHQLFCAVGYKLIESLKINLNVQRIQDLCIQTAPQLTQNYTLVNLRSIYRLNPFMEFSLSVNNILNQKYEINKGYPMPPTNIIGGVKFFFGKTI